MKAESQIPNPKSQTNPNDQNRKSETPIGQSPSLGFGPSGFLGIWDLRFGAWKLPAGGLVLAATLVWAYWPTLCRLVAVWKSQPDYSHGFLVIPLSAYFLWATRDRFPGLSPRFAWPGLVLVLLSIGLRVASARYFLEQIDGWSIPLAIAGMVWAFGGFRVLWWSLPSILFLLFMVDLPFRVERWVSLPLQTVATRISAWTLQLLGVPAVPVGHTIYVDQVSIPLFVAEQCSGLRIFVGILALAYAYLVLARQAWWERVVLLLSVVPIALAANAARIVATGLLYRYISEEAGRGFAHDSAGLAMIVLAAAMFALVVWYLRRLFRTEEPVDLKTFVRERLREDS
jgi:exosortase